MKEERRGSNMDGIAPGLEESVGGCFDWRAANNSLRAGSGVIVNVVECVGRRSEGLIRGLREDKVLIRKWVCWAGTRTTEMLSLS